MSSLRVSNALRASTSLSASARCRASFPRHCSFPLNLRGGEAIASASALNGAIVSQRAFSGSSFQRAADEEQQQLKLEYSKQPLEFWQNDENVKKFLDLFAEKNAIKGVEDWYKVTPPRIKEFGGTGLLDVRGTPQELLPQLYPEYDWAPWRLGRMPQGYWTDMNNQRFYMKWLAKELKRTEGVPEEWHVASKSDFARNYGNTLLHLYNDSPFQLLKAIYPEKEWLPWLFEKAPENIWGDVANHKRFMDWLIGKLGYKTPEEYYQITRRTVAKYGGQRLFDHYKDVCDLVQAIYPDFHFLPWRFESVPSGFWQNIDSRRSYVTWLVKKLQLKSMNELRLNHFLENFGTGLVKAYSSSPLGVIASLGQDFADPGIQPSGVAGEGGYTPKNHWDSMENQRAFADSLATKLKLPPGDLAAWYNVSLDDFLANGGSGIIEKYKSSPYLFLKATYPEFKWEPWQFARLPKEAKADPDTIKAVLNHLAEGLLIKGSEEWERVSAIHVKQLGVKAFFRTHKDMISLAEKYWRPPTK